GDTADGRNEIQVDSETDIELNRPYYVAASVETAGSGDRNFTFYVKDLSDNDAPLLVTQKTHAWNGSAPANRSFTLGGREGSDSSSAWDGFLDDVRLTAAALPHEKLLWE